MNTTVRALLTASLVVVTFGVAVAKLPAPVVDEKAKAAAEEKKAKEAATAATEKAALERSMDRVASRYITEMKAKGVEVHPTPVTAPPAASGAPPSAAAAANPTGPAATNAITTPQGNTPPNAK